MRNDTAQGREAGAVAQGESASPGKANGVGAQARKAGDI